MGRNPKQNNKWPFQQKMGYKIRIPRVRIVWVSGGLLTRSILTIKTFQISKKHFSLTTVLSIEIAPPKSVLFAVMTVHIY